MVRDDIKDMAVAVIAFLVVALGGSVLVAGCEDQDGGYPTPIVRSGAR